MNFHKKIDKHKTLIIKGVRFGAASFLALLLHFLINVLGHELLGVSLNILYPISLVAISLSTFLMLRFFVYPGAASKNAVKQGGEFIVSIIMFRFLEWALFGILYNVTGLWYIFCILIVQVLGTVSKFLFFNYFVFGSSKARNYTNDNK